MLNQLRIRNFKSWQDTGCIRMAPITLFFGANSSGKSSIGQFLLMLKQTIESPDRKAVFYPGGINSAVQLGSYQEMVFRRDPNKKITFEYQWSLPKHMEIGDPLSDDVFSGDKLHFSAEIEDPLSDDVFSGDKLDSNAEVERGNAARHLIQVAKLKYCLLDDRANHSSLSVELSRKPDKREYEASASPYNLVRKQGRAWALKDVVRFYGFSNESVARYQNADFMQELNLAQEKLFNSLYYLGPLRRKAERLYKWSGSAPESVGYEGENTVAAILAARDRKISPGYGKHAKPFEEIIAGKLKEMNLIDAFRVKPISAQRQEYEVQVRAKGSKDWVDLPDVGFGVSQVLPVLAQCFYAPPGSIILMEQPEIHLHPSAQSALADVMIAVIRSKENRKERGIQLIIESHSEHFLRRLQRRIAEGDVLKEEVSAYFANITGTPATLERLRIDDYGNIKNWPKDFFGDEMGDIIEQSKAAIKARGQNAKKSRQRK